MLTALTTVLLALGASPGQAEQETIVPDAGPDQELVLGQKAALSGHIEGLSPLDFWVADGNGPNENKLVRYSDRDGITAVGPMRRPSGHLMGWTGDLVRIEDRVYGIDVGARYVYVADLEGGLCLPVTPELDGRWKGLHSLAYDAGADRLYSVDLNSGQLLEIQRGTGKIKTIHAPDLLGRKGLRSLAFDQELELLFAADYASNVLLVVDPRTGGLADMMPLPPNEHGRIEELAFFQGQLYAMVGMLDGQGEYIGGQLQRIDLHSGYVHPVGPLVPEVSPHALLINSVPEDFYWSQVSGPAVAELEYRTLLETSARFSAPGSYEFALTVLTSAGPVSDGVTVLVRAAAEE